MQFHACWVIYTVKELNSHAKHGQSFKKRFERIRVFLCQIHTSGFLTSFRKFFSIMALHDVMKGGTPYMGICSRKNASAHASTRARSRARPSKRFIRLHCTGLALEECLQIIVFGCKGKITLLSSQKNPVLCEQWMQFVFWGSNGVSQVCLLMDVL